MERRDFLKANLALLGGAMLAGCSTPIGSLQPAAPPPPKLTLPTLEPGVKLGMRLRPGVTDADLQFMHQLGMRWCRLDIGPPDGSYDRTARLFERFDRNGIRIFTVAYGGMNHPSLLLGGPERDKKLEELGGYLQDLAKVGIQVTDISFCELGKGFNTYTTSTADMDGIPTRIFDLAENAKADKPVLDRRISADEVRAGVQILHGPPAAGGRSGRREVAVHPTTRRSTSSTASRRASFTRGTSTRKIFRMCPSPNLGVNFCVGTWSEAGPKSPAKAFARRCAASPNRAASSTATSATCAARCRAFRRPLSTTATPTCRPSWTRSSTSASTARWCPITCRRSRSPARRPPAATPRLHGGRRLQLRLHEDDAQKRRTPESVKPQNPARQGRRKHGTRMTRIGQIRTDHFRTAKTPRPQRIRMKNFRSWRSWRLGGSILFMLQKDRPQRRQDQVQRAGVVVRRLVHGSTSPMLPNPAPPYSSASLLSSSRHLPPRATPIR